ncbi:DNA polymerase V [Novosphingobium sp. PhB55]|nr:DNA polymerase V [Novosphingobium sp. PhB55]
MDEAIKRSVGLPTRIGLGPTRTLSKVAKALAKASEKVWNGVVDLHDEGLRRRLFAAWPIEEVWGIGPATARRLRPLGIRTTADLAALPPEVARDVGTVVLERLVRELGGTECTGFEPEPGALKSTAVTRCFGEPVREREALCEAMVRRAVRVAEKIRSQQLKASRLIAFAHGNRFKPDAPSAMRTGRLSPASNDPRVIAGMAGRMAEAMFEPSAVYTKCGVMLEGLEAEARGQFDMFAAMDTRSPALLAALDEINGKFGRQTLHLGSEGMGVKAYDTRRTFKSPSWTTRIDQVPIAR